MQTIVGYVTIVQESRFQLVDDDGIARLFVLRHEAELEPEHLMALARQQTRVRVAFSSGRDAIAGVARRLDLCSMSEETPRA